MGGGNLVVRLEKRHLLGLSPRGRGKQQRRLCAPPNRRSIPAWAGETHIVPYRNALIRVYPRVGGGNVAPVRHRYGVCGLSPRGRGKLSRARWGCLLSRSIPAWAGETISREEGRMATGVYPRVGGGNQRICMSSPHPYGLSPRGRGKPRQDTAAVLARWSIPAWAGETIAFGGDSGDGTVYPRVGGGNIPKCLHYQRYRGLSPRGRGKLVGGAQRFDGIGSIPAWAGETIYPKRMRWR